MPSLEGRGRTKAARWALPRTMLFLLGVILKDIVQGLFRLKPKGLGKQAGIQNDRILEVIHQKRWERAKPQHLAEQFGNNGGDGRQWHTDAATSDQSLLIGDPVVRGDVINPRVILDKGQLNSIRHIINMDKLHHG